MGQTISSYELGSFSEDEAKDFESATGKTYQIKRREKQKVEEKTTDDDAGDTLEGDDAGTENTTDNQ